MRYLSHLAFLLFLPLLLVLLSTVNADVESDIIAAAKPLLPGADAAYLAVMAWVVARDPKVNAAFRWLLTQEPQHVSNVFGELPAGNIIMRVKNNCVASSSECTSSLRALHNWMPTRVPDKVTQHPELSNLIPNAQLNPIPHPLAQAKKKKTTTTTTTKSASQSRPHAAL
ncbi:hypothetical protein RI367_005001 [Sorochytrium milnesiophthora]